MYLSVREKDKLLWTHSSLLAAERYSAIKKVKEGEGSFTNKFAFVCTYLALEAVNRIKPLKKLNLYYRAGIVGGTLLCDK
jgi:hypothetical protein